MSPPLGLKSVRRVIVVAPSASNNSLGRAFVVAQIASEIADHVEIVTIDDGRPWVGMGSAPCPVVLVRDARHLQGHLSTVSMQAGIDVVAVVKPVRASGESVLRWLAKSSSRPMLWLDEDDFDEAIHRYWISALPRPNRLLAQVKSPDAGWRIRRRLRKLAAAADVVSVSSAALGCRLELSGESVIRLPHGRPARQYRAPTQAHAGQLRMAFLGTPVPYKGVDIFSSLLQVFPSAELNVFSGVADRFPLTGQQRSRLNLFDGEREEAVTVAMAHTDVVVLPQEAGQDASRYQLPAKMMDALCHGRPVLVTRTPVTQEFSLPGVHLVNDWRDSEEIQAAFARVADKAKREEQGTEMAAAFALDLSTERLGQILAMRLDEALIRRASLTLSR